MEKVNRANIGWISKIFLILPFILYFLIATFKLATPSLWFGETLSHYGAQQNFEDINYLLVNTSFQPPLYSWILSLWLKINNSVFWIRFLSVIFGFIGAIGFYKSVREVSDKKLALFSVVIYSCIFRLAYFFQDATEYALMIANL